MDSHLELREGHSSIIEALNSFQFHLVLRRLLDDQNYGTELGVERVASQVKCTVELLRVSSDVVEVVLRPEKYFCSVLLSQSVGLALSRISLHQDGHLLIILESGVIVAVLEYD